MPGIEPGAFHMQSKRATTARKNVQKCAKTCKNVQKRASEIFLDPIQKRAPARSVQLEAVYLEALQYVPISDFVTEIEKTSKIFANKKYFCKCGKIWSQISLCEIVIHNWYLEVEKNNLWRCRGLNPGPFTCKANALPLRYIPFFLFASEFWKTKNFLFFNSFESKMQCFDWIDLIPETSV